MAERCSFCGSAASEDNALVAGGGPEADGLPRVQICSDCVIACGEALQIERRLGEARASQRPPPKSSRAPDQLGLISDWTPFTMEGRTLEWRAARALSTERKARTLLRIRGLGEDRELAVELEGSVASSREHALVAVAALDRPATGERAPELELLHDWTPFEHGGATYEWRAERAPALIMRPVVRVSIRDPKGGRAESMEFDPRVEPSVDEAVMVASASFRDARDLDDEVPDAVIT